MILLPSTRQRIARVPLLFRAHDCLDETGLFALSYGRKIYATFARTTRASAIDQRGRPVAVPSGQPRLSHVRDVSGVRRLTYLAETGRTNRILRNDAFDHATWSKGTGITVPTTNAIAPDGTPTADLLANDGSVAFAALTQTLTLLNDGVHAEEIYLRADTAAVTNLLMWDATAAVGRHHVLVTWTAGVPALSTVSGSGTLFDLEPLDGGWYLVRFNAAGIVAANTNQLSIYPSGTAATVGRVYAWRPQVEDGLVPSRTIATEAATVSRNADVAYVEVPGLNPPRPLSLFLAGVNEDGINGQPASRKYLHIGSSSGGTDPRFGIQINATGTLSAYYDDGVTPQFPGVAGALVRGDRIKALAALNGSWQVQSRLSVNGGAEAASVALASGPSTAWADDRINLGPTISDGGAFAYEGFAVAEGVSITLDEFSDLCELD